MLTYIVNESDRGRVAFYIWKLTEGGLDTSLCCYRGLLKNNTAHNFSFTTIAEHMSFDIKRLTSEQGTAYQLNLP
jgi:hypothetical protein